MCPVTAGRIINVASIMGFRGSSITTNLAYNTSKGAVVNFTRTLAGEWAAHGVRVNGIAPTYLLTPLTEKLRSDPGVHAKIVARTPMGTVGTPEDLIGAMLFLGSHASRPAWRSPLLGALDHAGPLELSDPSRVIAEHIAQDLPRVLTHPIGCGTAGC